MIDPATSWFQVVELPKLQRETSGSKVTKKNTKEADMTFDKSSAQISNLVYKTWFSRYPQCFFLIYNNGSKFKLPFRALCDSHGKSVSQPASKNPYANAILERIHAVMLCTAEIIMADSLKPSVIDVFLPDKTCHISLYLPYGT
jgi:hypothetical protein